jgi:AcrR family transcriptional regulator
MVAPQTMARTLDHEAHAVRRGTFLDAAQQLIQAKGYAQTSVQDVLDAVDTSKGAFYHYFDSKGALLNAVIERMVEGALDTVQPVLDDPALSAVQKLQGVFGGIASFKTARKDLLLRLTETWMSDDNALVRDKFRAMVSARLTPLLVAIVRQGKDEGTFRVRSANEAARVFVSFLMSLNSVATELYLERMADRITYDDAKRTLGAYAEAMERILGAPEGSMPFVDETVLREWFG